MQVQVVGHIPRGLPPLTAGQLVPAAGSLPEMCLVALAITLVGLMESIAVAKALADSHRYQISANQELLGEAPRPQPLLCWAVALEWSARSWRPHRGPSCAPCMR